MLKRTITGSIYVLIVIGFFLLREYVDTRLFNVLTAVFCAVGTFEVSRAIGKFLFKGVFSLAVIYGILFVPIYCAFQYLTPIINVKIFGGAAACLILCAIAVAFIAVYSAIKEKNVNGKNFGAALRAFIVNALPFIYPSLLLLTVLLANDLPFNGCKVCLILIFVISPAADTFAYLVGMTYNKIRKGKAKKMCPVLSPKKTWAGAIGGVIGGIVGALVVYFIFRADISAKYDFMPITLSFFIIGIFGSVLTEIGDLFESYIKRKVGIKDMGRIMPGHGGVMDRIDGMSFAAVFIYFWFLIFIG